MINNFQLQQSNDIQQQQQTNFAINNNINNNTSKSQSRKRRKNLESSLSSLSSSSSYHSTTNIVNDNNNDDLLLTTNCYANEPSLATTVTNVGSLVELHLLENSSTPTNPNSALSGSGGACNLHHIPASSKAECISIQHGGSINDNNNQAVSSSLYNFPSQNLILFDHQLAAGNCDIAALKCEKVATTTTTNNNSGNGHQLNDTQFIDYRRELLIESHRQHDLQKLQTDLQNTANNNNNPGSSNNICSGCCEMIFDKHLFKVGECQLWHSNCLKCRLCQTSLVQQTRCYVKGEATHPHCKACYQRQFGVKCARCNRSIQPTDWVRRAKQLVYHLACFACDTCKRQLSTGEEFALQDCRVLCKQHYTELFDCDNAKATLKQKTKRVRTTFTEEQLQILQVSFQQDSNPDGQDLERIANMTGLSKRVTQVWFQNSRARQKKYQGCGNGLPGQKIKMGSSGAGDASPDTADGQNGQQHLMSSCRGQGSTGDLSLLMYYTDDDDDENDDENSSSMTAAGEEDEDERITFLNMQR